MSTMASSRRNAVTSLYRPPAAAVFTAGKRGVILNNVGGVDGQFKCHCSASFRGNVLPSTVTGSRLSATAVRQVLSPVPDRSDTDAQRVTRLVTQARVT